ncbi:MAG TPA: hypothetical protein PK544_09390 [Spirochaetota bacterium]|nr:hypothetical protein [Spirochaetota bacterium]HPQ54162.1 hypothetical protein [Spirochaetota bacterium]
MKRIVLPLLLCVLVVWTACKKQPQFAEPNYVLQKWAKAIEKFDYRTYAACEAYPKSEPVFREMYSDYYLVDLMTTEVEELKGENVRKDQKGNNYLHRSVSFEGTIVDRRSRHPKGVMRGNAVFIKFVEGQRKNDGWLMSNRMLIPVER